MSKLWNDFNDFKSVTVTRENGEKMEFKIKQVTVDLFPSDEMRKISVRATNDDGGEIAFLLLDDPAICNAKKVDV